MALDVISYAAAKVAQAAAVASRRANGTSAVTKSGDLDNRIPQFRKSPNNPLITHATQGPITGLGSVYWPWCVDTQQCGPIGAPGRFLLYWSTDHDANAGGVGMAYSASPDKGFTVMAGIRYIDTGYLSAGAAVTLNTDDTITHTAHGMVAQQGVRIVGGAASGVAEATTYYLRDVTTNSYKLSPYRTSGGPVDITAAGSGTVYRVASQTETPSVVWDEKGVLTAGTGLTAAATTDRITHTAHSMVEGRSVRVTALSGATGLALATTYYLVNVQTNSYQLSATRGGAPVDITADGTVTVAYYGLLNMYYQTDGSGTLSTAGYKQSTSLAVSPNGIAWTRIGVVLDTMWGVGVADNINPGDKHTGYFKPFRVGDGWAGYSLYGGGNIPNFCFWTSTDGRTWRPDTQLLTAGGTDITGDLSRRVEWNSLNAFQYRNRLMALFATKSYSSGGDAGVTENYVGELTPDFRGFVGIPTATFLDAQPAIETTVNEPDSVMVADGKVYAYYRINGATGALCVSVAEG
ncbi:hypothetical protein [uncultured Gordonia sp.]|uniref:hypothetical protein n=1 Tax=uncultured Gordonia sp. TaxID=198437 RepID=UPI00258453D3|nr:hypothetical protein [uncultured Gordonia sp.]